MKRWHLAIMSCACLARASECHLPRNAEKLIAEQIAKSDHDFGRVDVSLSEAAPAVLRDPADQAASHSYCAAEVDGYPYSKSGQPYFMVIEGVALFDEHGRFVKMVNEDQVRWTAQKPRKKPHS